MLSDYPNQLVSYMLQAFVNASQSTARRRKCGALVLREIEQGYFQPLSSGCNGTRPGKSNWCEDPKGTSYTHSLIHAERNCLKKMQQQGVATKGCILLVTFIPCVDCCYDLVDSGIKEVYWCEDTSSGNHCADTSTSILEKHGVFVKQVPKLDIQKLNLAIAKGLDQDKFMGEPVGSEYTTFEMYIKMLDFQKFEELCSIFDVPTDVKDFMAKFTSDFEQHRNLQDIPYSMMEYLAERKKL